MKLSRFSKKVIAIACSIAMLVAGLAFVPSSAKADDYSDLTFRDIVNNQNNEFDPTLKGSQYAVAEDDSKTLNILFQNVAFGELYISGGAWSAADLTATINGVENSVTPEGAGLRCYNCANYLDRKYNEIDVSWNGGTSKIIIYCPLKTDPETTTVDPSAPTTTAGPTTTTAEPTTPAPSWKDIAGTNDIKYWSETKARVISYQKPAWAGLEEYGVYVEQPAGDGAPMTVTIDGVQTTINGDGDKGTFYAMGAGLLFYGSTLDKEEVNVQIHYAPNDDVELKFKNLNPTPTESQTETEEPSVEPSTEAPTETQAPTVTEAPSESESETETEEPTQAPGHTWISALDRWVHRQADGSFIVEDGAEYNAVPGLTAAYSGAWGGAELEVANDESDLYTLPVNVIRSGNVGGWTMQLHINYEGLDNTKVYEIDLKVDGNTIFSDTASAVAFYRKTVDIGGKLAVGEHVLTVEATEQEMPPAPVVETITITPRTAAIEENHNIWADWTNPSGTTKSYVYLGQVDNAHAAATLNNGWIFNDNAVQPMVGVDNVAQTRDASIKVQEGQTYTLIVESYDAWDRPTGTGTVQITIPGLTPEEQEIQEYMAKINTSENLAYQKTPIVASNQNTAGNICDGNKDSRWQADKNIDNTYFAVDLEGLYTVETVLVSWEASNATDYEIYTAGADGVYGDTPVATVSGLANNKGVIKLSKNISSNARYVKVVVTGWSDNARGYGISPYELAVFGSEIEGYYDVSEYKSTTPYTYPTKAGKIFAGWFTDDTCIEPYTGTTGLAYAKFIDEDVLGTKFQVALDGSAIRFLSSVDSMDYAEVGFKFTGTYKQSTVSEKTKTTEKLYSKITADGTSVLPTVFSEDSSYFFTYTIRGMEDAGQNSTWNVTPFYVTLDGTTVEGTPGVYPQN